MADTELSPQSFIVKVWLEEGREDGARVTWRGQITHVGDDQRMQLDDLDLVTLFIAGYLVRMGVRLGPCRRAWLAYTRWRRSRR